MGFGEDFENGFEDRLVMSTKGEFDVEENALRPRRLTMSCCTARPGWARRRSRISSPTSSGCRYG